jgi:hypothetical protein
MASTGKKEYTIKINGVTQGIKEVAKLEDAIDALDKSIDGLSAVNIKANATSTTRTKVLSEEEKIAKKLADTHAKIAAAGSEANKAQISATQDLRERTRETARAVAQEKLEVDSISAMGMQLTDLRNKYEDLSGAQRADINVGGALLEQIQGLDAEYKALRESTGNFRDSVGNYEKAMKGLGDLKDGLDKVGNGSTNLASTLVGSNDVLDTFGETTDAVAAASQGLQGTIALATQATQIYTMIVKENIIQEKAAAVMTGIRATQAKAAAAALALETEATAGATVAQAAFNIVASANPYVILALALIAVGAALFAFASRTDDAVEKQKEFNALQTISIDQLEQYATKVKEAADSRVTQLQSELDALVARGAKTAEIRTAEDNLMKERSANNARLHGFYGQEIDDLEANRKKVDDLRDVLARLNTEKARGESKVKLDIDLDGKIDKADIDDAITSVQGQIDNVGRKVAVAVEIKTDRQAIENEAREAAATRFKEDKDQRKEDAAAELADLRALQDSKAKLLKQTYDDRRAGLKQTNAREIEDLQVTLRTDEHLTAKSRELINANIVTLGKVLNKQLADLNKEYRADQLQSAREVIDSRNALIIGATDRQTVELQTKYARQIHDLENKLRDDTTLTVTQQSYLTEQILNAQTLRDRELAALQAAGLEARASEELARVDDTLAQEMDKITKFTGDLQVKSKTGLMLIDVAATRKNLAAANAVLGEYMGGLDRYQAQLNTAHAATLATLQQGTPEYQAELDKYAKATADTAKKVALAQNEQTQNTRASQMTQLEYYRDTAAKIGAIAQETVGILTQGTDLLASSVQSQIDSLTSSLDAVSSKYEDAKSLQEKAVQDVQSTEAQLQDATGGTADALRGQLADQMRARNEAARQEQKLAKEKQKLEADIAKKEKQAKRLEMIGNIAAATSNGFQAVTAALAAYPPPFSYVAAGITGALAAVQVAGMVKQLTKLQDGGEIVGPSHAQGGVPIGLGYEAEGGEFMVNKEAYSSNAQLIRFINESRGAVSAEDLVGLVPGGSPMIISDTGRNNNDDIVAAIEAIDIRPVVAVTDIMDVTAQITSVHELSGYNS